MSNDRESVALLPCPNPWCHYSEALPPVLIWGGVYSCYVECSSCGMVGPETSPVVYDDDGEVIASIDAEAQAVAAWNTRHTPAVTVPGWRMVPVEPTEAMLDAFVARALQVSVNGEGGWSAYGRNQWQQMLSAAPTPPVADDREERIAALEAALRLVEAAMLRRHGEIIGVGWNISLLNRARPAIHAALTPPHDKGGE